jgi:hypothetical protein
MSARIGGIDIVSEIVELTFQLRRTQSLLELIINNNQSLTKPTPSEVEAAEKEALSYVQKRFPDLGIHEKSS